MTLTTLLIGLVVLLAIGLLAAIWRPGYRAERPPYPAAVTQSPAEQMYRPIMRLFAQQDLLFLRQHPGYRPSMARRFRLQRRRVLALFLRDMHQQFRFVQRSCRLLARQTHNWELSYLAQRQAFVFLGLLLVLQTRCWLGWFVYVQIDAADLVSSLQKLQEGLRNVRASIGPSVGAAVSERG